MDGDVCILYVDETDIVYTWTHLDMYSYSCNWHVTAEAHLEGVLWL